MKNKFLSDELNFGSIRFTPFVNLVEGEIFLTYEASVTENHLHVWAKNDKFSDDLYINKTENGFVARRTFRNCSDSLLKLIELGVRFEGISLGAPERDYYYSNENPRIFDKLVLKVDSKRTEVSALESEFDEVAGNKWCDPGVINDRVNTSPYQPFPAILFANFDTTAGLVHGTLSQDVFYHCYLPSHKDGLFTFDAYSAFKDIAYREVKPGETLVDAWYIGRTDKADDIEHIFDGYTAELRRVLPANYGATSVNRDALVWGSWNDGIYWDVSEDLVLAEGEALVKYFPKVRWLQIDDGYAAYSKLGRLAHGLGVPYEGEDGVDKEKFPLGLKHTSDKIRELGLRPAIWIGGYCPRNTKICTERPDLMFEYNSRTRSSNILDVSKEATREYMTHALDVILNDWGFEGVKHDFWSYAFDVSEDLLANKDKSGYEHREWWCKEIRKRLPGDAHFQTGCDIVMGNPFLGKYFTNYRYGVDIDEPEWSQFRTIYCWCMACLATHTGDLFTPNSDAIGMFPKLSDNEAMFATNFIMITRTMVELAGRYSKVDPENPRFKVVRKATCHLNNGQDVYFANYDYRVDGALPEVVYIKTPHFSNEVCDFAPVRTVAVFNIEDGERKIAVTRRGLDLPLGDYILTDVWSGERLLLSEKTELILDPHSSRLFSVNKRESAVLLDAGVELCDMRLSGDALEATLNYPYECELTLAKKPTSVSLNGEAISFSLDGDVVRFTAREKGRLVIEF